MRRRAYWLVLAPVLAGLALTGCAETVASEEGGEKAATVLAVEGSDVKRVVLTQRAVERLDVQMGRVVDEAGVQVIPYASVVYDANGATWVYSRPEPLTFVRVPIAVTRIAGDKAFLSAGPPTGTEVVTVGTAELFGAENGIGH